MSKQNYLPFWEEALKLIHEEYKEQGKEDEFNLWFNMNYIGDEGTEITVEVPSEFMWRSMVSRGYVNAIQQKLFELLGQEITLDHTFKSKISPSVSQSKSTEKTRKPSKAKEKDTSKFIEFPELNTETEDVTEKTVPQKSKKHPQLREDYVFETFVTGENSQFACSAAQAVARNPGGIYNPILIYGGVGLGKTHLMQSIGNYIYAQKGDSVKICYLTAENFTNEFTSSIRDGTIEKFKSKYRKLDVLLLDDIHFLQEKEATQEELFHTFEALYNCKAQMVFTCDRPISELKGIEDRLKTRFTRGMCIDLQPPNYETRRAILQKKLALCGNQNISNEVIDYIAKNVMTNVRDLEACLTKITAFKDLINKDITIQTVQELLRDSFSQSSNGSITIETIQKVVCDHYSISISDIKSKKKSNKFVIPRQIAVYICRQITEFSFPEIGSEFGGRDHTTAMHSCKKIEDAIKIDSSLDTTIQMLIRQIKDYKK